jgi:thiol-disulfide isomerase/thioredoxin
MIDERNTTDGTDGAATQPAPPSGPGLLRTLAHRLAGDADVLPVEGHLASFDGATGWLNSEPVKPEGLRGRVILVDFWTYTCINWLRTLPYLKAWDAKYRDQGLTIIGVHTPEFGFERDLDNIVAQSRNFGVEYPVAIDSDYGVWQAFANHFWPAAYIADAEGRIRFHHFGEGEYAMTEMVIQQLLTDAGATASTPTWSRSRLAASKSPPTGERCDRPKRTSGTVRARVSRQPTSRHSTSPTSMPHPHGSRSTTGISRGTGGSPGTPQFWTSPADG